MKKVVIVGNFGKIKKSVDGQTVKTRNVYKLIKENSKDNVIQFDTSLHLYQIYKLFSGLYNILTSEIIVYIPGRKSLETIGTLLRFIKKLKTVKVHYFIVGGWLFEEMKMNKMIKNNVLCFDFIYSENKKLSINMKRYYGLNNILFFPNFRFKCDQTTQLPKIFSDMNTKIHFCYVGRITEKKGLSLIIELFKDKYISSKCDISIYGQVDPLYADFFYSEIKKNSSVIKYGGLLDPETVVNLIKQYDLLLFPTQYFTEGMPGVLVDAFMAELPALVTRWEYADEMIDDNLNGFIVPFTADVNIFRDKIIHILENPDCLNRVKSNLASLKKLYSSDYCLSVLNKYVIIDN